MRVEILTLFRSFSNFLSSLENDPSRIIEIIWNRYYNRNLPKIETIDIWVMLIFKIDLIQLYGVIWPSIKYEIVLFDSDFFVQYCIYINRVIHGFLSKKSKTSEGLWPTLYVTVLTASDIFQCTICFGILVWCFTVSANVPFGPPSQIDPFHGRFWIG